MIMVVDLPDELLTCLLHEWIEILDVGMLDGAVCQRDARVRFANGLSQAWSGYTTMNTFQQLIHGSFLSYHVYETFLRWVQKRGIIIQDLIITPVFRDDRTFCLELLTQIGKYVHDINVCGYHKHYKACAWNLTSETATIVMDLCPNVRTINIGSNVTHEICLQVLERSWPNLTSLSIVCSVGDPDEFFDRLDRHKKLTHLKVPPIAFGSTRRAVNRWGEFLRCSGKQLKSITNVWADFDRAVFEFCPNLRSFGAERLYCSHHLIQYLQSGCPNVSELKIHYDPDYCANGIMALACIAKQLTTLEIKSDDVSLPEQAVCSVLQKCVNLRKFGANVRTSWPNGLTDQALQTLGAHCPELEELLLTGSPHEAVTDVGVVALGAGCPKLQVLCLSQSTVTDAGFTALLQGCPRLSDLTLRNCYQLTDSTMIALSTLCPRLRRLIILADWAITFTPAGVLAVVEGCRGLRVLHVVCRWEQRVVEKLTDSIRLLSTKTRTPFTVINDRINC